VLAWLGFPGWTLFIAFLPLLYLDHFFVERKSEYKSVSFWSHAFLDFFHLEYFNYLVDSTRHRCRRLQLWQMLPILF
jgi:hypothetical protein